MAAYCFFDVREVVDPAKMEDYRRNVLATVEQYGGRYVVIGGTCDVIEGQWKPNFPVIIRFPNLEQAHNWYHSEEYKYLKALRLSGSKCDAVFMESASGEFVSES